MGTGKKALLITVAAALLAAGVIYRDYQWYFVASAVAFALRALIFTRRF